MSTHSFNEDKERQLSFVWDTNPEPIVSERAVKFSTVAQTFDQIEQVSGRLKITQLLADLFASATPSEASIISYFSLGKRLGNSTKFHRHESGTPVPARSKHLDTTL